MPVNWEQLHIALSELSHEAAARSAVVQQAREASLLSLRRYAREPQLGERVEDVVSMFDPDLRCALPGVEALDMSSAAATTRRPQAIIAADGSQVTPSRHEQVCFGVINVGTVVMQPESDKAPTVSADTRILFGESLYGHVGMPLSEGDIALLRDQGERASLLLHAHDLAAPALALTDGPLELWGGKDVSDPTAFDRALRSYLDDLDEMERLQCSVAGYVDKPGADLVIRLFEVVGADHDQLTHLRAFHPLRGATDRWLYSQILAPGERSAVLGLQSSSARRYTGDLSIHFFYLNVGTEAHPAIARVEIPRWVAQDAGLLGAIHTELIEQCLLLGASPYPYILHRAHEIARISSQEKEEIRLRLTLDLLDGGLELEDPSGKSTAKLSSSLKGSY